MGSTEAASAARRGDTSASLTEETLILRGKVLSDVVDSYNDCSRLFAEVL